MGTVDLEFEGEAPFKASLSTKGSEDSKPTSEIKNLLLLERGQKVSD